MSYLTDYGIDGATKIAAGNGLRAVLSRGSMVSMTAVGLLIRLDELALKREEFEDKKKRLDEGRPTEIIKNDTDITLRIDQLRKQVFGDTLDKGSVQTSVGDAPHSGHIENQTVQVHDALGTQTGQQTVG
jgi:hypothetical protein